MCGKREKRMEKKTLRQTFLALFPSFLLLEFSSIFPLFLIIFASRDVFVDVDRCTLREEEKTWFGSRDERTSNSFLSSFSSSKKGVVFISLFLPSFAMGKLPVSKQASKATERGLLLHLPPFSHEYSLQCMCVQKV